MKLHAADPSWKSSNSNSDNSEAGVAAPSSLKVTQTRKHTHTHSCVSKGCQFKSNKTTTTLRQTVKFFFNRIFHRIQKPRDRMTEDKF